MQFPRRQRLVAAAGAAGLASLLAIGSALGADSTVTMSGFAFDPATVTVEVGDSVTWQNQDDVGHTATGAGGAFDTGTVAGGGSASVTFDAAGTFAYACTIHPTMQGTVVVEPAAPPSGPAGVTPAPTDTARPGDEEGPDATGIVAALLAVLGVTMLVGTIGFDRRARVRERD
jgi:plastocyanin